MVLFITLEHIKSIDIYCISYIQRDLLLSLYAKWNATGDANLAQASLKTINSKFRKRQNRPYTCLLSSSPSLHSLNLISVNDSIN